MNQFCHFIVLFKCCAKCWQMHPYHERQIQMEYVKFLTFYQYVAIPLYSTSFQHLTCINTELNGKEFFVCDTDQLCA